MTTLQRPLSALVALALAAALPAQAADGDPGAYLAARQASYGSDYVAASTYFARAMTADPTNAFLLENLVVAEIGVGAVDAAIAPATRARDAGVKSQIGNLVLLAGLAQREDYAGLIDGLGKGLTGGPLVDGLLKAWALVGLGQMSEATQAFDAIASAPGSKAFGLYHKALALASVGDFEGADKIFSGEEGGPLRATRRGIIAHAQILSQLERAADGVKLIDDTMAQPLDPAYATLRDELAAGKPVPFTVVTSARDGIGEVFYTIGVALNGETTDLNTLGYSRLSEYLTPGLSEPVLLSAAILDEQGEHALAAESFAKIGSGDPAYISAQLGLAEALYAGGETEAALDVASKLADAYPDRAEALLQLGDIYRRSQRFDEALKLYDRVIAGYTAETPSQWVVYYMRGIANEQEKHWPAAEADFRKALALSPDQPSVLNYLAYSYLERHERFDEALSMLERAAAAEPDNGAIADSLGWAYFRVGRFPEATEQLERAVELEASDAVINDHLGDAYWAVGRKREAEFQWKRALSFEPSPETKPDRIRRKLEVGLDEVLKEEGAKPLDAGKNDG